MVCRMCVPFAQIVGGSLTRRPAIHQFPQLVHRIDRVGLGEMLEAPILTQHASAARRSEQAVLVQQQQVLRVDDRNQAFDLADLLLQVQ